MVVFFWVVYDSVGSCFFFLFLGLYFMLFSRCGSKLVSIVEFGGRKEGLQWCWSTSISWSWSNLMSSCFAVIGVVFDFRELGCRLVLLECLLLIGFHDWILIFIRLHVFHVLWSWDRTILNWDDYFGYCVGFSPFSVCIDVCICELFSDLFDEFQYCWLCHLFQSLTCAATTTITTLYPFVSELLLLKFVYRHQFGHVNCWSASRTLLICLLIIIKLLKYCCLYYFTV